MEAIYQRDSDQDGLTDAQELALGTNPLEKDFQDIDQISITEPSSVFMEMKQKISDMMESHYKEFIQALISIETGIENQQDLEDLYTYYMRTDAVSLLSSDLETSPQEVEIEIELWGWDKKILTLGILYYKFLKLID